VLNSCTSGRGDHGTCPGGVDGKIADRRVRMFPCAPVEAEDLFAGLVLGHPKVELPDQRPTCEPQLLVQVDRACHPMETEQPSSSQRRFPGPGTLLE
jgi:hypothetical protein